MNEVSQETVDAVQAYLQGIRDNLYSFETDSGKADMITGKIVANYQWSGDAVYAMDQAEEDAYILNFTVPRECTNIYFDGWIMLKNGINGDAEKQQAAEAFINFISRPDNAIRNMYYIGYTSAISGGEDERIFEYLDWNYGAGEDEEEVVDYPVGYFFAGEEDNEDYVLSVPEEQLHRQLSAQYPSKDVIRRASIMVYFNPEQNELINRMWVRVRCFNILSVPVWAWIAIGVLIVSGVLFGCRRKIVREQQYK
jgi:spermidine/putrescine transport system substrate-binding protein